MKKYLKYHHHRRKYLPFRAFIYMMLFIMLLIICAGISSAMSTNDRNLIGGFCHVAYHTELLIPY